MSSESQGAHYSLERELFGLNIRFCSGKGQNDPDSQPDVLLKPADIRSPRGKNALKEALQTSPDSTEWSNCRVGLPSLRGEWFLAAGALRDLGVKNLIVITPAHLNEKFSAIRTCIPVWSKKVIFLPSRKCGYSSLREYCLQNFSECRRTHQQKGGVSHSLNEDVDLRADNARGCFSLSLIRNPMRRFESFYVDKLSRDSERNRRHYYEPFERLLGPGGVTPLNVLDVIERIPDEFRDPHFRSQSINLFLGQDLLVDQTIAIEGPEPEFSNAMQNICLPAGLPHVLSTKQIRGKPAIAESLSNPSLVARIEEVYREDFDRLGYDRLQ